jgi:ubiquinone/menaquinone biosynthesis C-methylase UbiE
MRDIARQQARGLAARLGLAAGQSLLDLAGGPGVYGLTFAEETPGLAVTVLDLPGAEPFFREEAALHPAAAGVAFRPGNYEQADLGGPYDVVWLSQVLHGEGPDKCEALLAKAASALRPGGELWVQEFVVQEMGGHPFCSLFSLNMLINTQHGQGYDAAQLGGMMTAAGLAEVEFVGPTREGAPAALMRGRKPA